MNLLLKEYIGCVVSVKIGDNLITGILDCYSYDDIYMLKDGFYELVYFKAHKVDYIALSNNNLENFKAKQKEERDEFLKKQEELEIQQICDTDDFNPFDYKEEE
jgi:hypothetical protein